MRKREFVGISAAVGVVCTLMMIIYHIGNGKGYMKGYREADNQRTNESIKSV